MHFGIWDAITVIAFQSATGCYDFDADLSRVIYLLPRTCPKIGVNFWILIMKCVKRETSQTILVSLFLLQNVCRIRKSPSIIPMVFTQQIHSVLCNISRGRRHHSQVSLQYIIRVKSCRYAKHPETRRDRVLDATAWCCAKSNWGDKLAVLTDAYNNNKLTISLKSTVAG